MIFMMIIFKKGVKFNTMRRVYHLLEPLVWCRWLDVRVAEEFKETTRALII